MNVKHVKILLIEDSESDIRLTQEALNLAKILVDMVVVKDGEAALKYLRKEPPYEKTDQVCMILLDLNIPKVHGLEVLRQIKEDALLKIIPVIILTSSQAETDIVQSYTTGAAAFCTKPISFKTFQELVVKLTDFWFAFVKYPNPETSL